MNFTYDLTGVYGRLNEFGNDKNFGIGDDSENNPLKLKKTEFVKNNGDRFMIIKYDRDILTDDMREKTGLFRSLIFKNGKLVVFSPPKSVSYQNFDSRIESMTTDDSTTKVDVVAEEFVEGTMINLFYDYSSVGDSSSGEDGEWEISTRSTVGAKMYYYQNDNDKRTFRQMFLDAMIECNLDFEHLNKDYCYSFVLQHPGNRIVCPIVKPQLYVGAVYKIHQTDSEIKVEQILETPEFISNTGVLIPEKLSETSVEDLKFKYASMNTPYDTMGFVMKENTTGIRCKFRNPGYDDIKMLRGNQPKLLYQYISLRKMARVGTYLKYFPEHKEEFNNMRERIHNFTTTLHNNYVSCFVFKEKPFKEYSSQFRTHMYKLHAFYMEELREQKGKIDRTFVIQYVNALHPAQLMFSLNFNYRKQNVDFVKKDRGELPEKEDEIAAEETVFTDST